MAGTSRLLIVLCALASLGGCAYQGSLPDPYPSLGSSWGGGYSSPYGGMGISPYYFGYGATDPYYYYRRGYSGFGYGYYYPYAQYPGHYCADANRDGRCDRARDDDDRDDDGRGNDHDGGAGPRPDRDGPVVVPRGPRDPKRFTPDKRPDQRANPDRSPGRAGVVPRAVPRKVPATPRPAPAAPRERPQPDDPVPPSPRLRGADRR